MKKGLLLDLDGTLLDTAPDVTAAVNELLVEEGRAPVSIVEIRKAMPHGPLGLVSLGFGALDEEEHIRLYQRMANLHRNRLAAQTCVFEGFENLFARLKELDIRWGVVTNRPAWLTEPLLDATGLCPQCVISGDTLAECKPHPLPLLHAAKLLNVEPANCIYVGDAQHDIQAARAAGMTSLIALWGYLSEEDRPHTWQADGMIETPQDVLTWLLSNDEARFAPAGA